MSKTGKYSRRLLASITPSSIAGHSIIVNYQPLLLSSVRVYVFHVVSCVPLGIMYFFHSLHLYNYVIVRHSVYFLRTLRFYSYFTSFEAIIFTIRNVLPYTVITVCKRP